MGVYCFPLDHFERVQGQVLELKGESSSPRSLATAMLPLHRVVEWVDGEEGCGKPFGIRGVGGGSQINHYYCSSR